MPNETQDDLDLFAAALETEGADADGMADDAPDWLEAVAADYALPFALPALPLAPRPYQKDALTAWGRAHGRGVVVLPTGAGKTVVALMTMEAMQVTTLVVVPTIDLMHQWHDGIQEKLGLDAAQVGMIGGGSKRPAR